ncbi:hypothetical protein M3Y96_00208100 [Aphelenchoides besseyi]|nr:hypothetical protein M3Y96_00208100 [Aphelenchoides besseyi]
MASRSMEDALAVAITPEQDVQFELMWNSINKADDQIAKAHALSIIEARGITDNETKAKIFELADIYKTNKLSLQGFKIAQVFCDLAKSDKPLIEYFPTIKTDYQSAIKESPKPTSVAIKRGISNEDVHPLKRPRRALESDTDVQENNAMEDVFANLMRDQLQRKSKAELIELLMNQRHREKPKTVKHITGFDFDNPEDIGAWFNKLRLQEDELQWHLDFIFKRLLRLDMKQIGVVIYLINRLQEIMHTFPIGHGLHGLELSWWIRNTLRIAPMFTTPFGEKNGIHGQCYGVQNGKRPSFKFITEYNNEKHILTSRLIAYMLYGNPEDNEITASHLCGNRECVSPNHIIFEPLDINRSRDRCHMIDLLEFCTHEPKCLHSTKAINDEETEIIKIVQSSEAEFTKNRYGKSFAKIDNYVYVQEVIYKDRWICVNSDELLCTANLTMAGNDLNFRCDKHSPDCVADWDALQNTELIEFNPDAYLFETLEPHQINRNCDGIITTIKHGRHTYYNKNTAKFSSYTYTWICGRHYTQDCNAQAFFLEEQMMFCLLRAPHTCIAHENRSEQVRNPFYVFERHGLAIPTDQFERLPESAISKSTKGRKVITLNGYTYLERIKCRRNYVRFICTVNQCESQVFISKDFQYYEFSPKVPHNH